MNLPQGSKLSAFFKASDYRTLSRAIEQGELTGAQMQLLRTLMDELAEVAEQVEGLTEGKRHGH